MNRAIVAGALALASVATGVALAPTASASAQSCARSYLTTGIRDGVGSQVQKSSTSSCNDLNLTWSLNTTSRGGDYYAGRLYWSSLGRWRTCDKGYVWAYDGYHDVNESRYWLCTAVNDGTWFTVASWSLDDPTGDYVEITH